MTNFEKIMQSKEELTNFFNMNMKEFCKRKPDCDHRFSKDESVCIECIKKWLSEEAEE